VRVSQGGVSQLRGKLSVMVCRCRSIWRSALGNVWVMNNWEDIDSCFGTSNEALSTRCGRQDVTMFFAMAKPVNSPQIGHVKAVELKSIRGRGSDPL
jgi:hypothetical protein